MECLETATLCDISPLVFWELTPFELSLMFKAFVKKKEEGSKENLTLAYLNALWTVQWLGKKHQQPKPLKEILNSIGKEQRMMTDNEMLEKVKVLNAIFGGEVKEVGKE